MNTVLITGANSGIGYEMARQLAGRGMQVILSCRSLAKAQATQKRILENQPQAQTIPLEMDLSSLKSVSQAVQHLQNPFEALICNAGLSYSQPTRYTQEGVELTFGVNHLGHFALVKALMKKYPDSLKRILVVASDAHNPQKGGGPFPPPNFSSIRELAYPDESNVKDWGRQGGLRYVHSKLCNVWFAYELARKLGTQAYVNAINPGFIPGTGLGRDANGFQRFLLKHVLPRMKFMIKQIRTVEESASDLIYVCFDTSYTGRYFDGRKEVASSDWSYDIEWARKLWEESEKLIRELAPSSTTFNN